MGPYVVPEASRVVRARCSQTAWHHSGRPAGQGWGSFFGAAARPARNSPLLDGARVER